MSRAGTEDKIPWQAVPLGVRRRVEEALGRAIVRGARVWGGYGPTPTFRLLLADGSRAFFKGTNATSNEFARRALVREERVYRELGETIGSWSPRFFGAFQLDDWHVLLLEDVGRTTAPSWTPAITQRVMHAYADFHASTLGSELPDWLPRLGNVARRLTLSRVADESGGLHAVAALAHGREAEALAWLQAALPKLSAAAEAVAELDGPYALLHGDTRSDNLRFRDGHLALFDWPSIKVGRPEFDLVVFAQTIAVEGGRAPEQIVAYYEERLPLHAEALDACVAWWAAYFADLAWRPDIPGLPRLRPFQRAQLRVLLAWAARRLAFSEPVWLSSVA